MQSFLEGCGVSPSPRWNRVKDVVGLLALPLPQYLEREKSPVEIGLTQDYYITL